MRWKIAAALAALAAALGGTFAFTGTRAPAEEQGLLLGLATGQTIWIARQGSTMRALWETPYVVTPRRDGYWYVVSAERCSVDTNPPAPSLLRTAFVDREQRIAVARAGDTIDIPLGELQDCKTVEHDVFRLRTIRYKAALDSMNGDSSKVDAPKPSEIDDQVDCNTTSESVSFVSRTAIAIEGRGGQSEYCNPSGYTNEGFNRVLQLGTKRRIALRPLLTAKVRRAAEEAISANDGCAYDHAVERLDNAWAPERKAGRWVANLYMGGANSCRGGSDYEFEIRLPQSFTGEPPLSPAWTGIGANSIRDATLSPSRSYIALFMNDTLVIRRVVGDEWMEVVGKVPLHTIASLVSARWATAADAERWTRELPTLKPPIVRVVTRR